MVARILTKIALLALLAVPALAQTYNQNPGEWACRVSTFQCQNVVMTTGDKFTINEAYSQIYPGAQFVWDGIQGAVTSVTKQLPVYWANGTYYVEYDIELADGRTATVSSTVTITRVGRWPLAHVSETVITFN